MICKKCGNLSATIYIELEDDEFECGHCYGGAISKMEVILKQAQEKAQSKVATKTDKLKKTDRRKK